MLYKLRRKLFNMNLFHTKSIKAVSYNSNVTRKLNIAVIKVKTANRVFKNIKKRERWLRRFKIKNSQVRPLFKSAWVSKYRKFNLDVSQKFLPKEQSTVRNATFKPQIFYNFTKLINYADLPYNFNLRPYKLLRYNAMFYGHNYQRNTFSYNLWLTMGLKKNLSVPFGFFYNTNNPRWDFMASVNTDSWRRYVYLIKDSFVRLQSTILCSVSSFSLNLYNNDVSFFNLSDISNWIRRKKYKFHRPVSLLPDDLDFSISTYHSKFDYYDLRNRSQFFWIANDSIFRETAFYITSFDTSVILYPQRFFWYWSYLPTVSKFHRSWFFMNKINNWSKDQLLISLINILQNCYMKNYFLNFLNFVHFDLKLFSIFKLVLFKLIYCVFIKHIQLISYDITSKLISLYKNKLNVIIIGNVSKEINLEVYLGSKIQKSLKLLKSFVQHSRNLKILGSIKSIKLPIIFKHLLLQKGLNALVFNRLVNISAVYKKLKKFSAYLVKNISKWSLFHNVKILNKFRFLNMYISSHGFLKMRFLRCKMAKGYTRYYSLGTKYLLQVRKKYQTLNRFRKLAYKYKYTPQIVQTLNRFLNSAFDILFVCYQKNLNISLNFFDNQLLESFYFQLYFLLFKLFGFYKEHICISMPSNLYFKRNDKLIYSFLLKKNLTCESNKVNNFIFNKNFNRLRLCS